MVALAAPAMRCYLLVIQRLGRCLSRALVLSLKKATFVETVREHCYPVGVEIGRILGVE
jgi:hypothetical protein